MKHCFVRPFTPVFEREITAWMVRPTTMPKKLWAIVRAKMRKTGQLELELVF